MTNGVTSNGVAGDSDEEMEVNQELGATRSQEKTIQDWREDSSWTALAGKSDNTQIKSTTKLE